MYFKIKKMSLFQIDGFLEKLTRVELKKHFQKKKIVRTLYLQGPMTLSEIMKGIDVSTPYAAKPD